MERRCSLDDDFCDELKRLTNGGDDMYTKSSDDDCDKGSPTSQLKLLSKPCFANSFGRGRKIYGPIVDNGISDWDTSELCPRQAGSSPLAPKGRGRLFPTSSEESHKLTLDIKRQCQEIFGNGPREVELGPQHYTTSKTTDAHSSQADQYENFCERSLNISQTRGGSVHSSHVNSGIGGNDIVPVNHLTANGSQRHSFDRDHATSQTKSPQPLDNFDRNILANECNYPGGQYSRLPVDGGKRSDDFVWPPTVAGIPYAALPAGCEVNDDDEIYYSSDEENMQYPSAPTSFAVMAETKPVVQKLPVEVSPGGPGASHGNQTVMTEIRRPSASKPQPFTEVRKPYKAERKPSAQLYAVNKNPMTKNKYPLTEKKTIVPQLKMPVVSNRSIISHCTSKYLEKEEWTSCLPEVSPHERFSVFGGRLEGPDTWSRDGDFPSLPSSSGLSVNSDRRNSPPVFGGRLEMPDTWSRDGDLPSLPSASGLSVKSDRQNSPPASAAHAQHRSGSPKMVVLTKAPNAGSSGTGRGILGAKPVVVDKPQKPNVSDLGTLVETVFSAKPTDALSSVKPVIEAITVAKALSPSDCMKSSVIEVCRNPQESTAADDFGATAACISEKPPIVLLMENLPNSISLKDLHEFLETFGTIANLRLESNESGTKTNAFIGIFCESTCEFLISCLDGSQVPFEGTHEDDVLIVTKIK